MLRNGEMGHGLLSADRRREGDRNVERLRLEEGLFSTSESRAPNASASILELEELDELEEELAGGVRTPLW